jgi:hypothetical protein
MVAVFPAPEVAVVKILSRAFPIKCDEKKNGTRSESLLVRSSIVPLFEITRGFFIYLSP